VSPTLTTEPGLASEDFVIFRGRFTRAAQNRIHTNDQVDKLREALAGKALACLPQGVEDIDIAWKYLGQAFGDSRTILSFHLGKLASMPSLTDEIVVTNPQEAADWCFTMETLVDNVLRVGTRSQELRYAFNRPTTYRCIISKLPVMLMDITYDILTELDTLGEEKMRQILQLIRGAKAKTQARATDTASVMFLSTTTLDTPISLPIVSSMTDPITDTETPSPSSTPYTPPDEALQGSEQTQSSPISPWMRPLCCLRRTRSLCQHGRLGPWQ
jgi:hypothetical protein